MKWKETVASRCRYEEIAEKIFGNGDVIWEHSEDSYQGFANVLVLMPDGKFAHYIWTYGSCSGCDEWESRGLSDEEIETEMRNATSWIQDIETLKRYVHLEGEFQDAKLPTANDPTNGSIPGMLHFLSGGYSEDFDSMRRAVMAWLLEKAGGQDGQAKEPR